MKRKQPNRTEEQNFQIALAQWLNVALPSDGSVFWTAIDASIGMSGEKARTIGAFKKAMGCKAGTPDLLFVWQGEALFIELKVDVERIDTRTMKRTVTRGKLSALQQEAHINIMRADGHVFVCRSTGEVESFLRNFGIPLRDTMYQDHPVRRIHV